MTVFGDGVMPDQTPANPTSHTGAPPVNAPIANSAKPGAIPAAGRPARTDRVANAREQMRDVGRGMKDWTIKNTSVPVEPRPESDVDQSRASNIVPQTEAPKPLATTQPATTPEAKAAAAETAKKLSDAKRVLARDGYEPEEIAAMSEEKLLARAAVRAKVQADVDKLGTEHAALKRSMPQPRTPEGKFDAKEVPVTGQPGTEPTPAAQPQALSTNPEVDALLQQAKASMGTEAATVLGKIANALEATTNSRVQAAEMMARTQLSEQGQRMMQEKYPDQAAENPAAFEDVQKNFAVLCASGRYDMNQIPKAWADALHMAFGPPNEVLNAQRGMLSRQLAANNGAIDVGAARNPATTGQPASKRDLLKAAGQLMAANPGGNLDQMRQTLAGMTGR
jgi:hypothetical protein